MKIGDLYKVITSTSHTTSHKCNVVVVQNWTKGVHENNKSYMLVRAFNVNRQCVHDYFFYQLKKVNK